MVSVETSSKNTRDTALIALAAVLTIACVWLFPASMVSSSTIVVACVAAFFAWIKSPMKINRPCHVAGALCALALASAAAIEDVSSALGMAIAAVVFGVLLYKKLDPSTFGHPEPDLDRRYASIVATSACALLCAMSWTFARIQNGYVPLDNALLTALHGLSIGATVATARAIVRDTMTTKTQEK